MTAAKSSEQIELDQLNASGSRSGPTRQASKPSLWSLVWSPFNAMHRIFAFLTTFIPYLSRFSLKSVPKRRQLSPRDTSSRFIREFEELYGNQHITFETRGYAEATQFVKENDLYLMVVLISDVHDDTPAFCKDVLCDERLEEWLRANDCVVWAGNLADSEAHTLSNSMGCTRFPFIALVANVPSPTPSSPPQLTVLTRIEGVVTTTQLTTTLTTSVTRTRAVVNRQRALKQEQRAARELRRMQEEAYSNSLAQDRAREEQERRAAQEAERLELERQEKQRLAEARQRTREQWRLWKASDLKKKGVIGMKSEIGKTARVGLRLANGERIVQIFPADMTLADVYSFVDCYDLLFPQNNDGGVSLRSSSDATISGEFERPSGYEHEFMFRLVVAYPRKVIDSGFDLVKHESALWPSGSIVVEEIEEDDEDDEDLEEEDDEETGPEE